jgi:hypothetical protein
MTWFAADEEIKWYNPNSLGEIRENVRNFLMESKMV